MKPKRTWRSAPARVARKKPGVWIWLCHAKHPNMPPTSAAATGLAGYPSMGDAVTGLAKHQREHHPGPTFVALAAARRRRTEGAYQALLDARLTPALDDAGVDMLEAAMVLAQDPAAFAAVRELAREVKGGEPG